MAEPGRGSLRLGAVLALAVVALFELLALAHGLRAQRRLRDRVAADAARRVAAARPQLDPVLAHGREAWDQAAEQAIALGLASEVEVIDASGQVVFSRPHVAPVVHRLSGSERAELGLGRSVTAVALDGPELRVLTQLALPGAPGTMLRLSARAGDLEDDAREWHTVLLGHAAALSALALAVALVLWPSAGAMPAPADGALTAYEEAIGRLRDRGQELRDRYQEDKLRMEARLRELEAMARAGELTAGIVHEVRNGLGTITGYARLLERARGGEPPAETRAILDECATLETVVRRFSDFIRLERLQLADTDIAPLAARVVAREQHGHATVAARLVGLDAPFVVRADEELLERALENVVRNAFQAAGAGGGHLELRAERTPEGVVLSVEDDGPGLAPDHPAEVRPFYTTRPGGLGLGLPLARKIVLLHGGELVLERRSPVGARVLVLLPAESRPS